MPDLTPDQRIDRDRRAKWQAFRRKHGIADDAPFLGQCPWVETYQEMLDALNYLDQVTKPDGFREILAWRNAKIYVRHAALICLRNMKGGAQAEAER